jgi:SAM-dependent methyltransferase
MDVTEIFEHVPDDARGFAELHRVLAPGGHLLLTVPLSDAAFTVERAVLEEGVVRHLLPPTYHDDQIRGTGGVLVYRDYGRDITQRLAQAGFTEAEIIEVPDPAGLGACAPVVVAQKLSSPART